jgi:hypothetical protein
MAKIDIVRNPIDTWGKYRLSSVSIEAPNDIAQRLPHLVIESITPKEKLDRAQKALTPILINRSVFNFLRLSRIIAGTYTLRTTLDNVGFPQANIALDETNRQQPVLVVTLPESK